MFFDLRHGMLALEGQSHKYPGCLYGIQSIQKANIHDDDFWYESFSISYRNEMDELCGFSFTVIKGTQELSGISRGKGDGGGEITEVELSPALIQYVVDAMRGMSDADLHDRMVVK